MKLTLQPNEMIIRAGNSSLRQHDQQVQGKLIVTNQRIYFKSLNNETRHYDREIVPGEIRDLFFFNTLWLIPNGMNIVTNQGEEIHFTVKNRCEWAKLITKMY